MFIYDSVKKEKVEFVPIVKDKVRIYLCGPTVYDDAHLGHARSAITFDLLRRVLVANGYEVTFVKNFTDIDDKIVKKSKISGESVEVITQRYTKAYLDDMGMLGVERADIEPSVTQNLDSIFSMIENLLHKGKAYKADNGDIYMRVSADSKYGSISNRKDLESQISRIEQNDFKEDSRDFALWKIFNEDDDVAYDSPFGRGRPGWHIECSAIIQKHLAYDGMEFLIDIHAGGSDLLFPHHENEASQSRCSNKVELSKYWMHNGFVNINGEKMSKSLGNSFFIKDALKHYDGEILRYYLISTHYRSPLHFSTSDLEQSKKRLDKIYRLKKRLDVEDLSVDSVFEAGLLEALNDDMNISKALSLIDAMVVSYNELLDKNPKDKDAKIRAKSNIAFISKILGIGGMDAIAYFHLGVSDDMRRYIQEQISLRNDAKKNKNYVLSDKIRDDLRAKNILLLDTKDGVVWECE